MKEKYMEIEQETETKDDFVDKAKNAPPITITVENKLPTVQDHPLVEDEYLLDLYKEILEDVRVDRIEVDGLLSNFTDMVFNGGDVSGSSKEAVVNLVKIKTDILDKKTKIADLLTSLKIKEKNSSKSSTNQANHIHITDRRSIIEAVNSIAKKEKNELLDS
jgi:hypothetical protein